jgi:hypothetical protein
MQDLHLFVAQLLKYADAADCRQKGCRLLVANFSLPDGGTSHYGVLLADELSSDLQDKTTRSKSSIVLSYQLVSKKNVSRW